MKNKKGVEMNINTIIIVILAILVLVILSLYFTGSIKKLWPNAGTFNEADITSARQACTALCGLDSYSFCTQTFDVHKGNETITVHCDENPIYASKTDDCKEWFKTIDCAEIRSR